MSHHESDASSVSPAPRAAEAASIAPSAWIPRSRINLACGALLVGGGLLFAIQGLFDDGGLRSVQDHVITYSFSRQVAETHTYFRDFTYPLPAVIWKLQLGRLGMGVSSVLWSIATLIALAAVVLGMVQLLGTRNDSRALLGPTLACGVWVWCVQWDFRAVNVNLVFTALALWGVVRAAQGHAVSAGALLAASVALKLYAAPLVLYLALRRWWRVLVWTIVFGTALFVVLPILYFGPADAWLLTGLWLRTVIGAMQPGFVVDLVAYKVSLEWVLLQLFDPEQQGRAWLVVALRGTQLGVLLGIATHLVLANRHPERWPAGERLLMDAGLLLCAMVLLSPLAEPHHGVVALLPATLLAYTALDADRGQAVRSLAAAALVFVALCLELAPSGTWKGAAFVLGLGVMIISLPLVERMRRGGQSA